MDELVTVIIPVYRVEGLLSRCVDSVLKQTHTSLEVILVDDGSPDRCPALCDQYALRDSRVMVIHQPNQGLAAARNAGLDQRTGRYVTFLDSDDWLHEAFVETLMSAMVTNCADIAMSGLRRLAAEGTPEERTPANVFTLSGREALSELVEPLRPFTQPPNFSAGAACAKLYRSELFDSLRFPPGRIHEDTFTTWRAFLAARRVVVVTSRLYYYWQRPGSITGSGFRVEARLDAMDAIAERASTLRELGFRRESSVSYGQALSIYVRIRQNVRRQPKSAQVHNTRIEATALHMVRQMQPLRFRLVYLAEMLAPMVVHAAFEAYSRLRGLRSPFGRDSRRLNS